VGDEGTQRRDVWSAAVKLKCSRRDNVSTWDPKKASAGVGADCYRWPVMQWWQTGYLVKECRSSTAGLKDVKRHGIGGK